MSLEHDSESYKLSEQADRSRLNRQLSEDANHYHARQTHLAGSDTTEEAVSVDTRETDQQFNIAYRPHKDEPIPEPDNAEYISISQTGILEQRAELKKNYLDAAVEEKDRNNELWDVNTSAPMALGTVEVIKDNLTLSSDRKGVKTIHSGVSNKAMSRLNHASGKLDNIDAWEKASDRELKRLEHDKIRITRSAGRLEHDVRRVKTDRKVQKAYNLYHHGKKAVRGALNDEETDLDHAKDNIRNARRVYKKTRARLRHRNDRRRINSALRDLAIVEESMYEKYSPRRNREFDYSQTIYDDSTVKARRRQKELAEQQKRSQRKKRNQRIFEDKKESESILASVTAIIFGRKNKRMQELARKQMMRNLLLALGPIIAVIFIILILLVLIIIVLYYLFGGIVAGFTSPNDISTLSDTTEGMQALVAELEYHLTVPEGIEEYKELLTEEYFSELEHEIDEWDFDVPDDFTWSVHELAAYFSAKYHTYELADVQAEIEEIFKEWFEFEYVLETEVQEKTENGILVRYNYYTAHIKITKKDLSEIIKERADELPDSNQYYMYLESSNGQQTFGPVIEGTWPKITSGFGSRVDPITGEIKTHGGVDIAVPMGTLVYSPFDGTIQCLEDSSYGHYIKITDDQGWSVIMAHLSDNTVVASGTKVLRGQCVGKSGSSGRSTGPHLHLEVRDANNTKYDARYYIPSTSYAAGNTGS